jgi:hypothetical protein
LVCRLSCVDSAHSSHCHQARKRIIRRPTISSISAWYGAHNKRSENTRTNAFAPMHYLIK